MKKRYFCKRLNETLNFDALKVFYCCATRTGPSIDVPQPKRIKDIIKKRNSLIKMLDRGIIPTECEGCFDLEEQKNPKPLFISQLSKPQKANLIIVKHFKQCDCACTYCCEQYLSGRKIVLKSRKSDYYDLLPIIKELYKQDMIDKKELDVHFQGGNVSVLDEFEDLVNIFMKNGVKRVEIATNGIKYLPAIERICNDTFVDVNISIDAGSRETYKKIKTVDKFDDLIENLKKYAKLPILLRLKYILVRNVNDTKEELEKYINLMKEIGITNSELMIDQCDNEFIQNGEFKIPDYYYELFEFYKNKCQENNIEANIWEYIKEILDKGSFFK
ncbi:MAG: radical SAM protein [Cyanobacteria bacterium SIG29]|nr:radical SAM protein [Cyanobacteria bacterium SIG29]